MNFHIIETWQDFLDLQNYVVSNKFEHVFIDTETDSVNERKARLFGVGLCFQDHEAFYIPIRKKDEAFWWTSYQEQTIASFIKEVCISKKIVGHNVIYDVLVLQQNWGFDLTPYLYSDTILMKHAVDEERPFGLKEVAVKYLGPNSDKAQKALYENIKDNGGSTTKDNLQMFKADTHILGEYCAWDVLLTCKLFNLFEPRIKEEGLVDLFYKDEIMPLYKEVTIPMKQRGFNINLEYFKELNFNISQEIETLERKVQESIEPLVKEFIDKHLNENYPAKRSGSFPKYAAEVLGIALPRNKDGKVTLAAKEIAKLECSGVEEPDHFIHWLQNKVDTLNQELIVKVQRHWHEAENPTEKYIFNLKSNNHLKHLFFEVLGETPLSQTDGGEPKVDETFLDSITSSQEWVQTFIDYKKLIKLKTTYIEGILDRHIEGIIYTSYIQFGPPSGRYASRDPNLQNLPRIKEDDSGLSENVLKYVNAIKKGFIAPEGYSLVNADYSQLEPRAFAEACGDYLLQQVFHNKEDLYGSIAKTVWNLDCKANEVKKKYPEKRQQAKVIALAVVYGAGAGRISKLMNVSYDEAQAVIDQYLNAYPGLTKFMEDCDKQVCTKGFVVSKFGRVRHLPEAKSLYKSYGLKLLNKRWAKDRGLEELSWKFKNMLNLAKNYPIQTVAGHTVNRASIAIAREIKNNNLDARMIAQTHDELTFVCKTEQAEQLKAIVKDRMENTTKLSVPLVAEPIIGSNWAEVK